MTSRAYKKSDFWYDLPKELIAQEPIEPRDSSRLFVYDRQRKKIEHRRFSDIVDYFGPHDLLVLNDTKVMPARLLGQKKETGGKAEVFLLKKLSGNNGREIWQVLLGGKPAVNQEIVISPRLSAKPLCNNGDGTWQAELSLGGRQLGIEIESIGHMPLPPYIRKGVDKHDDKGRYQTVFSKEAKKASVAAPTAGLHFTKELLGRLKRKGVGIAELTLHVGIGTFAPVKADNIEDHRMHGEHYEVSQALIGKIIATKKNGGRVVAVGTTSARTLETIAGIMERGELSRDKTIRDMTDIFVCPGYKFKVVDCLITNFHLPESTLLMLLAAFLGPSNGLEIEKQIYALAIKNKYRFFSYGDAMLIL